MKSKKIGWIGLGKMGLPMSKHLLDAGYSLYAYSRNKENINSQITFTSTIRELIDSTDILFLMVPDDYAVREIFEEPEGLLSADLQGKTIINMSTVSAFISREMAEKCTSKGCGYIDAPVSGSVKQAHEANLVVMVGGKQSSYEEVMPLLELLGSKIIYIGNSGTGNLAKLAINTYLSIQAQGLAEVANIAQYNNLDIEKILSIINNGVLGSIFSQLKSNIIMEGNYEAAFSLSMMAKDLNLAKDEGLLSPLANAARNSFEEASQNYGSEDVMAIKKHLENLQQQMLKL